jgi:hypothetical protein
VETERFYSIVRNTKLGICPERHAADPDIYHRAVAGGALRAQGLSDKKLVEQVADVKLTERMSDPTFAHISADLRGPKSRMALLGLADESQSSICRLRGFPPRPHLPNFTATRESKLFDGTPLLVSPDLHHSLIPSINESSRLFMTGPGRIDVRYSEGLEVFINPKNKTQMTCDPIARGDEPSDFGELLPRVACEMIKGKVVWSHGEQGTGGVFPVFHFEARLLWNFPHRCRNELDVPRPTPVKFRGELAIDPQSGPVLRVTERFHTI